jgi:hypothetical protein
MDENSKLWMKTTSTWMKNEKVTIKLFLCGRFRLVPNMSPRFEKSQK